ncbi:unnamed protein product [Choristocarpus tenellus]
MQKKETSTMTATKVISSIWREAGIGIGLGLVAATVYYQAVSANDAKKIKAFYKKEESSD